MVIKRLIYLFLVFGLPTLIMWLMLLIQLFKEDVDE